MKKHDGFTLFELLAVILILSVVALSSLAIIPEQDFQLRFEDTRNRVIAIRRAVLGKNAVVNQSIALSGFVVDNGALPGAMPELTAKPSNALSHGSLSPYFSSIVGVPEAVVICVPISDCRLTEAQEQLLKGHRQQYLQNDIGVNKFLDGWRNGKNDTVNFGWSFSGGSRMRVASLGLDNTLGNPSGLSVYNEDMAMNDINELDWRVPVGTLPVHIVNNHTAAVKASLLIFVNDPVQGETWLRVDTNEIAAGVTGDAFFTATNVPMGRHLIVITAGTGLFGASNTRLTRVIDLTPGLQLPNNIEFTVN